MSWKESMESGKRGLLSYFRNMTGKQWLVILLAGVLLVVIALPVENKKPAISGESTELDWESMTEKQKLEKSLENLLSNVEGVGKVQVMLTLEEKKDVFSGSSQAGKVTGVLVAAQGAGSPVVVRNIQQAVMALFQVEAHKIKVMKMK